MSAYVVSNETINQVLSYLNRASASDCHLGYAFKRLGYSLNDFDSLQKLGQDLLDLNVLAVNTRYAHNPDAKHDPQCHVFRFVNCSPVQAYKSAQCLHYQCSEEKAVETKLYEALTDEVHGLAAHIIQHVACVEGYRAATWGAR